MSSGYISEDRSSASFEFSNGDGLKCRFTLLKESLTSEDKILLKYDILDHLSSDCGFNSSQTFLIKKSRSAVLSHIFRHMAELMDEWFSEELKDSSLSNTTKEYFKEKENGKTKD